MYTFILSTTLKFKIILQLFKNHLNVHVYEIKTFKNLRTTIKTNMTNCY